MEFLKKNPYPPRGRSVETPRGTGVLEAEAKYEVKLKFPGGRVQNKSLPCGGGGGGVWTDIFWNCTM